MKNQALRYLSRLVVATGALSTPKLVTDGTVKLKVEPSETTFRTRLECAARRDAQISEEAQALAEQRGWRLIKQGAGHERWPRLDHSNLRDCLPRLVRILRREAWEARDMARACDDEEAASLLHHFATERDALVAELERLEPVANQPGA